MDRNPDVPLQPVDRAALRLPRGGRPGAASTAIKEKVAAGQWEPIGGDVGRARHQHADRRVASSASSSTASATSSRRSARRHTVCWLPDCFGFSPALPQLLSLAGITSFFTIKVNWSETNTHARTTSSGGRASTARACSRTPSTTRSAAITAGSARAPCSRPGGTSRARTRNPESLLAVRLRRRRRRPDRGDARARSASSRTSLRCRALRWSRSRTGSPTPAQRAEDSPTCRSGSARSTSSSTAAR